MRCARRVQEFLHVHGVGECGSDGLETVGRLNHPLHHKNANPPHLAASPTMLDKIKPILITAVIAIIAVGLFSRFAPASVKKLVNG